MLTWLLLYRIPSFLFADCLLPHKSHVWLSGHDQWVNISHEPSWKPIFSFSPLACFHIQIYRNLTHAAAYQITRCFSSSCGSESLYFQSKFRPFWRDVMIETFFFSSCCLLWTLNSRNSPPLLSATRNWLGSHWALGGKTMFYSFMFVSVLNIEHRHEVIYGSWCCLISKPSPQMP